jgi:hypothetical protein
LQACLAPSWRPRYPCCITWLKASAPQTSQAFAGGWSGWQAAVVKQGHWPRLQPTTGCLLGIPQPSDLAAVADINSQGCPMLPACRRMQGDYEYFAAAAEARSDVALSEYPTNPAPCPAGGPAPLLRIAACSLGAWCSCFWRRCRSRRGGLGCASHVPSALGCSCPLPLTSDLAAAGCRASRAAGCPRAEISGRLHTGAPRGACCWR